MSGKTLRSIALARARLHLNWKVAAYKLQRRFHLKEAGVRDILTPGVRSDRRKRAAQSEKRLGNDDARAVLGTFKRLPR